MRIWKNTDGGRSDGALDHERLNALINSLSDGVLATDKTGLITLSNSVALNILDTNSLNGRNLLSVFKPIDKAGQAVNLQTAILQGPPSFTTSDWRLRYADGSSINIFFSASQVRGGFGSNSQDGLVLLFRDITQEKSLEEEREEFVSVASHELRTPIAIAEGNISNVLQLSEKANMPDSIKLSLAAAHDQVIFLGNLINDLSMLSRAERGVLALTVEPISVPELVGSLEHDYSGQAQRKGLEFKIHLSPDVSTLNSSRLYVREILQNLITNSLKYTDRGSVAVGAEALNDGVQFSIIDTGIGISKSEQSKLFNKFFRSDDWRVKKINGTGLGLYITSKLVKLLNANIEIDSELNKGSSFKVFVPNLPLPEPVKK